MDGLFRKMNKERLLIVLCFALNACTKVPMRAEVIAAINNRAEGYQYELWLNDEPVIYNSGWSTNRWIGSPLAQGKNKAEVRIQLSSSEPTLDLDFFVREDDADSSILSVSQRKVTEPQVLGAEFELRSRPLPQRDRVKITGSQKRILAAAQKLIVALASGDKREVLKYLRIDPTKARPLFPEWVNASKIAEKRLDRYYAKNESDFICVIGQKFALVRPALALIARGENALVRIQDKKEDISFELSCLVFSIDEKNVLWLESGPTGGAVPIVEGQTEENLP